MKTKKIIASTLGCIMAFGSLFGCAKNDNTKEPDKGKTYEEEFFSTDKRGVHVNEVKKQNGFIVENGKTEYRLVLDSDDSSCLTAAQQISKYLADATGCNMEIVRDEDIQDYSATSKYIFVGNNKYMEEAGISYEYDVIRTNGFSIQSVGSNYFIGACTKRGVEYAVYEFLHHLIGFEQYSPKFMYYETLKDVPFYEMNIVEAPDFEWREMGSSFSSPADKAMRVNPLGELWMQGDFTLEVDGETYSLKMPYCHNSLSFLPKAIYQKDHEGWYSEGAPEGSQLCYSARGNEEERALMVDAAFETLKALVLAKPNMNIVALVAQDDGKWCQCESCGNERDKYGTDSAIYIKFINELAKKLQAWIDEGVEVSKDRDVTLYLMAYQKTISAPAKLNDKGEYEPIDESVRLEKNVGVWLAPIKMNFTKKITDPENADSRENFAKWGAISDHMSFWLYQTNFSNYLLPYPTWGTYSDIYQYCYELGGQLMYNQGQYNNYGNTAFYDLKTYLDTKLSWNVHLDESKLIDDYFRHVYGAAYGTMKKYFDEMNAHYAYVIKEYEIKPGVYEPTNEPEYWPYPVVQRWMDYLDFALEEIKPMAETNSRIYEQQRKMIVSESIFPRYIDVNYYSDYYPLNEANQIKRAFVSDISYTSIQRLNEWETIDSLTGKWQGI